MFSFYGEKLGVRFSLLKGTCNYWFFSLTTMIAQLNEHYFHKILCIDMALDGMCLLVWDIYFDWCLYIASCGLECCFHSAPCFSFLDMFEHYDLTVWLYFFLSTPCVLGLFICFFLIIKFLVTCLKNNVGYIVVCALNAPWVVQKSILLLWKICGLGF